MAVPLWIPWSLVPVGGLLLALQFISRIAGDLTEKRSELPGREKG